MSMDTTASLLLKKQLAELMKSPDSGRSNIMRVKILSLILIDFEPENLSRRFALAFLGFSAGLVDDNDIFKWEVLIIGPPGKTHKD